MVFVPDWPLQTATTNSRAILQFMNVLDFNFDFTLLAKMLADFKVAELNFAEAN